MRRHSFITAVALAILALATVAFAVEGNSSPYSDSIGDIAPTITTAGGTLDIVGMEVSNTLTDISFKLTVNGNVNPGTGGIDWAKYMIGIASAQSDGTMTGNGWGRPINLSLDNDPFSVLTTGMDFWVGSWVDGSSAQAAVGGSELYAYNGISSQWARLGATWDAGTYPYAYTVTPGAQSTVEWTFPLSVFGLAVGNRFYFDVYSSGGNGGDSAIDSLANPTVSVTDWGGDPAATPPGYTSYASLFGGPGLNSYQIAAVVPEPSTMAMTAGAVLSGGLLLRRRKRKA